MKGINIVCLRVDERLIHGQIGLSWANAVNTNLIMVLNDKLAGDKSRQALSKMIIPDKYGLRFVTLDYGIKILPEATVDQRLFIIVKRLEDVVEIVNAGVEVEEINLGNLLSLNPVKRLSDNVSLNEADVNNIIYLLSKGVRIELRSLPQEEKVYINEI